MDNRGLHAACESSDEVVCCFVLDPRQATEHPWRSLNALQFMFRSLEELDGELRKRGGRLVLFEGLPEDAVQELVQEHGVSAVHVNEDYTPFSKKRDEALEQRCAALGASFQSHFDLLLTRPGDVLTGQGTPYVVFTPFMRAASERVVPRPEGVPDAVFLSLDADTGISLAEAAPRYIEAPNDRLAVKGGREEGLGLIRKIGGLRDYGVARDFPARAATSRLSAHHKFGTVSIRESWHAIRDALGPDSKLIPELYWRDFYSHLAHFFPHVFGKPFKKAYEKVEWDTDQELFERWCRGETGFPIVDAGMRELITTGYMHNRVRMIVASFLTKDLHLDWQMGERFFATRLVDYDPAVNNGSWQWAASTGADAAPYFRIFNPWRQQERFDRDCVYIKRWIPALEGLPPKAIHALESKRPPGLREADYPSPMVSHAEEREEALVRFGDISPSVRGG